MTDLAQHRNHYDPKGVRVPREPGGSDQRGCLRTTHLPEPAAEVQPRLAVRQDTRAQSKRCTMCLKPNTPLIPPNFCSPCLFALCCSLHVWQTFDTFYIANFWPLSALDTDHPEMTFRDIRAWLHQRSLLAIAPLVALAGIDDLATFRNMDRAALVRIGVPHDQINRLLGDDQLVLDYMPPVRRDIQPYHTTRHGSLNRAIAAGAPTSREQALQLLEDETYAPSSRDPRVAR